MPLGVLESSKFNYFTNMIPSHKLATWLLGTIDWTLDRVGLEQSQAAEEILYFIVVLFMAIGVGWGLRELILWCLRRWARLKNSDWSHELLRQHTLGHCCRIIPPLVLLGFLPFAFDSSAHWHIWVTRAVAVWTLLALGQGLSAVAKFIWVRYDQKENSRHLPMRGVYDLAIGIVWIVVAILCVSVMVGKSPAILLTGLGAFAAALMLVFKDSILGFVAGIQMSNNDMLRVGDWITVPGTLADGVVVDVNISVVKVQNFDNTMVMLPPYTLVSTSFQNWRGMTQSGVRLISRSIIIDAASVVADSDGTSTNLTRFRSAVKDYLNAHPKVAHNTVGNVLTMVRLMPVQASGIPMQIYCFANTTVWPDYEAVQSEIIEHVTSMAPQFSLTVYNYPK